MINNQSTDRKKGQYSYANFVLLVVIYGTSAAVSVYLIYGLISSVISFIKLSA